MPLNIRRHLLDGQCIPAHPLALTAERKLDERRQRALTRYYVESGVGGVAVGVHTTQFAIRDRKHGLLKPVLELASETVDDYSTKLGFTVAKIAGVCGKTPEAAAEAEMAAGVGYHAGLLSLASLADAGDERLLQHCRVVGANIPLIGFYLQPAVGGRVLGYSFWRQFVEIDSVVAIKIAPFNRYQTLDVVRAVTESGRTDIALYTGNDDNIVMDLLTPYELVVGGRPQTLRFVGGLLGHWSVWTKSAVQMMERVKRFRDAGPVHPDWMKMAVHMTDMNAAIFDAANGYRGCIAGIHEVLRRQGFLEGTWCLDPGEGLSPGQSEEIDRVYASYQYLVDDPFVSKRISAWLDD
jgi:dihydrodipicolinate synthase/N-acetylneuraminate lyase